MLYLRKNPRNFSPFRFADHKLSIKSRILFMRESEVNILGKGENSHNQHCLLFAECFRKRKKKTLKNQDCLAKGLITSNAIFT